VIEMIAKEDTSIELGGRKQTVTTMFCDIRGFTLMAERLSPAALVDMLNEHFTAMTGIVFHFQGTLDKYIGDEVMAVFGSPLSAPDDAERAVRAGLAMQAKNAELNGIRLREGREVFDFGVGIDTGEVIAAYMGSPERMEFTVIGDRVNTARRLCSLAAGGQVVVGESTYELVKELVYAKPIGTVVLRGKEAPVHAYEITALK
jgi:adenylate cyclase